MKTGVNNFTAERVAELRKNIDLSDIPEVTDFSQGHLRNWKPQKNFIIKSRKIMTQTKNKKRSRGYGGMSYDD